MTALKMFSWSWISSKKGSVSMKSRRGIRGHFRSRFTYFHQQLEELKNIYEIYFKNDIAGFKKYQTLVNYYLFLSDLAESLKEKSLYKEEAKEAISGLYGEIEDIFSEKKDFDQEIFQKFNLILEGIAPVGTLTTQEIYGMIREEIEVWD